jgi:DNA adenine methylase
MPLPMKKTPLSLQPIPYQGSKRALAPRICSLFPDKVQTLYEPFAGSAAITLFAATHGLAEKFVIADTYVPLIDLWQLIVENPGKLSDLYSATWHAQFNVGPGHFNQVRAEFNESKDPVLLLYLTARCVKNAVRFNKKGQFTQSADKRRSGMKPDRVTRTAHAVSRLLKGRVSLFRGDFRDCTSAATPSDLVYMDPPYQGTTYGTDKRYAAGLEREKLIEALHDFDARSVSYVLSYDGQMGDKIYGEPLPASIDADHLAIHAGRSSQATISGGTEETIESLYVSRLLNAGGADIYRVRSVQDSLFA